MKEIKFRAWDKKKKQWANLYDTGSAFAIEPANGKSYWVEMGEMIEEATDLILIQYTGLKDKNGLTDIYEGDIIDINGNMKGNVYETPNRQTTDLVIAGLGTKTWRDAEQRAMERGCHYAE